MTRGEIEQAARRLLGDMWAQRALLCPERSLGRIEILDPGYAAKFLLINFEIVDQIGTPFPYRGERFEAAGLLDRQNRWILVSRRFSRQIMLFTGAHEIGHWVLHEDEVIHRDRAIDGPRYGTRTPREAKEREADYFAACFLMPRELVIEELEKRFSTSGTLLVNDDVANMLSPQNPGDFLKSSLEERAATVALARYYGTRHFVPLHEQFSVSVSAMAYRLKELNLVA